MNILICDDDEDVIDLMTIILSKEGHKVSSVRSCERIWEVQQQADVIFMDLLMPRMGGEAATRILKKDPDTQKIKVVLFSALPNVGDIASKCGADGYLSKPFHIQVLREILVELSKN